jgi:hypothetical protein
MQALEEESKRVLKKQRLSASQIDRQLDALLEEVQTTKQRLVDEQDELRRKKTRRSGNGGGNGEASADVSSSRAAEESKEEDKESVVEEQDDAMEMVVRDFIRRVRLLHVEKNVAAELKSIHVLLSKYSKQIDKVPRCCSLLSMCSFRLTCGGACAAPCAAPWASRICAATLPKCVDPASWTRSRCFA